MDLNSHRSEIELFLSDLRDHLRYSIEPTEYENTVNLFGDSSEYQNRKFLERCEKILGYFTDTSNNNHKQMQNGFATPPDKTVRSTRTSLVEHAESEEISYLEMSATPPKKSLSTEYIDFQEQKTTETPSQPLALSKDADNEDEYDDEDDEKNKILDKGIYDICNESPQSDEALKSNQDENSIVQDCPYAGLPASHLSIQKSTKFGQLQRIEKRLFFDQSKKCYCGILSDWLLCYCDGVTSLRPTFSVYLKAQGVEVEHHGEGKRREICFQITTPDPNKKHVFQCSSEVEAKEWIHAIEAAIRGDSNAQSAANKSPRKLPTPPTLKKTYIDETNSRNSSNNDCIYEEPSPLYNMHHPTELLIERNEEEQIMVPDIPEKQKSLSNIAKKFDYDVPKSPPLPVNSESETAELLDISRNNSDFQSRVKDVHSKLSSQLSATGPSPERLKKIAKKTLSSDSETSALSPQQTPTTKEQKKANKSAQKLSKTPNQEKSSRNWFLNRLNKSTSSTRSSTTSPTKCKQSEKENLLNNLEICDGYEGDFISPTNGTTSIKGSKVNMIINQFEASGHLAMFGVEPFNGGHSEAKLSSFCDSDCNNYEPIMTGPSNYMKKV